LYSITSSLGEAAQAKSKKPDEVLCLYASGLRKSPFRGNVKPDACNKVEDHAKKTEL
jgi:hypothetical protein